MAQLWTDLSRTRGYILAMALLFAAGSVIGYTSNVFYEFLVGQIDALRQAAEQLNRMEQPQFWVFLFIFFNNSIKAVAIMFLGAAFGLVPLLFIAINGMILGLVVKLAASAGHDPVKLVVEGILPHGILELPAIVIAGAFGLRFGAVVLRAARGAARSGEVGEYVRTLGRMSAWLVTVLLVAAVIESTITFWLVKG